MRVETMQDHEPRIVSGVRGARSRYFVRRFPNAAAMEKWLDENADDLRVDEIARVVTR